MPDIFNATYIRKFFVDANRNNDSLIRVSSQFLSPQGDQFVLEKTTISPTAIQTTQSLEDLQPEVSDVYPFKIVPPKNSEGVTLIRAQTLESFPTAAQNYYIETIFERYNETAMRTVDKRFTELLVG